MGPVSCSLLLPPHVAEPVLRVAAMSHLVAAARALGHLVVVPVREGLLAALVATVAELGRGRGRASPSGGGFARGGLGGAGGGVVVVGVMDLQRAGQKASG